LAVALAWPVAWGRAELWAKVQERYLPPVQEMRVVGAYPAGADRPPGSAIKVAENTIWVSWWDPPCGFNFSLPLKGTFDLDKTEGLN